MSLSKALTAAAGNAGAGESLYVEDVFSTYLLQSTSLGVSETVSNGVNLLDEGGLVWSKARDGAGSNILVDTERGASDCIFSDTTGAEVNINTITTQFYIDGFESGSWINSGGTAQDYASWTFRKAEKFFDVVTYTGTGGSGQTVSHNLGAVPACYIVKATSQGSHWVVYHSSTGTERLRLNTTEAADESGFWATAPTDSEFTVSNPDVNTSGVTYVAYLFASDAGGFGDDGSKSIIKCGSFTASSGVEVDLGFEPQWILTKSATNAADWYMFDNMRGWGADRGSNDKWLQANTSGAEYDSTNSLGLTPTGFTSFNASGQTYIYIAIRRPMKTPESGTEVFEALSYTGTGGSQVLNTSFASDTVIHKSRTSSDTYHGDIFIHDRLRGVKNSKQILRLTKQNFQSGNTSYWIHEMNNDNLKWASLADEATGNLSSTPYVLYNFKRAPGFMDVVAYTGDGIAGRTVAHNLGVVPELMIVKSRSSAEDWLVYHKELNINGDSRPETDYIFLNGAANGGDEASVWNDTSPTDSVFTVGTNSGTNGSTKTYIAYLFSTLAGVSKVGKYIGTGTTLSVDCGFSTGARFILIKRQGTGGWYVWDTARGIIAGSDPYLLLNSTAAEVTSTDYIQPLASGFTVQSSAPAALNASGGTYIFLAIA